MKGNSMLAIIWDMDGTMVDTREAHWLAWKKILADEKYDLTWETFLKTFGQRNDTILRSLLGVSLPDAEIVRIGDTKEEAFREVLKGEGVKLLPGAGQIIDQAETNGWPQAVVSSAPRMNITAILEALNRPDTFTVLICAEDVSQGKPHPEGCITASRKLGVSPKNCIVLEDAPAGLTAARRAGMACVGVLSTHDHLSNADRVVNTLEEITLTDLEALVHEHKAF
ncbi:MAG: HAD family phosphatase [Desulfatiglans sp.]|nr:HAD family phosphatase [Desulfatiglans sp.]